MARLFKAKSDVGVIVELPFCAIGSAFQGKIGLWSYHVSRLLDNWLGFLRHTRSLKLLFNYLFARSVRLFEANPTRFSALIDKGFGFSAPGAGGFKVFGALGCVVVLGVQNFQRWTPGGRDFGSGAPKN